MKTMRVYNQCVYTSVHSIFHNKYERKIDFFQFFIFVFKSKIEKCKFEFDFSFLFLNRKLENVLTNFYISSSFFSCVAKVPGSLFFTDEVCLCWSIM